MNDRAPRLIAGYARLAVRVGVNLQPGRARVNCLVEHAPLARVVAAEAYAAGARYVDVYYSDQHVRRAHMPSTRRTTALGWSPPWLVQRLNDLGADGGALLAIIGNPEPGALRRPRRRPRRRRTRMRDGRARRACA